MKQLEREKNTSTVAPFPSYNKNLSTVDNQSICNRFQNVGHTEQVFRQSSHNQQHNTHSYNSYLSLRNTSNIRDSPLFNGESPNNQYMHLRYNPQQHPQNQHDQHEQPVIQQDLVTSLTNIIGRVLSCSGIKKWKSGSNNMAHYKSNGRWFSHSSQNSSRSN